MREIRELTKAQIDEYTEIAYNAYPSFKDFSKDSVEKYKKNVAEIMDNDPDVTFFGLFEEEELLAVMRLFDFQMNCFGKVIPVSGLGFLGVHLMHKKEKVAKAMVTFYEEHYQKKGLPIGTLLPFRPDFYKKMGYGIGTKMNQYRLAPHQIPAYFEKSDLRYIKKQELDSVFACYSRVAEKTHGMMMKFGDEIRNMREEEFDRIIGCYDDSGALCGYMVFRFQNGREGNYTQNNINVKELVYEDTVTLRKLLGFLRKQEDQVQLVIFNTQDENFHYLFDNPINDNMSYIPFGNIETNLQAVGIMYKIFDVEKAFEQCAHRNYNHTNLTVCFYIENELYGTKSKTIVQFKEGKALVLRQNEKKVDVTLCAKSSYFSSLFLGSVSIKGLYALGLVELDQIEFLEELDRAFYCSQKPIGNTDF